MARKPRRKRVNATGRNEPSDQFAKLTYHMLASDAWRSLRGPSVKVFLELRTKYNGYNNGKLSLSYQIAAVRLGLSKTTVKRAFDELQEKGFVKLRASGQWYGRRAAEWIVTDCSYNGHPPTRDWRGWRSTKKQKSVSTRNGRHNSGPPEYPSH